MKPSTDALVVGGFAIFYPLVNGVALEKTYSYPPTVGFFAHDASEDLALAGMNQHKDG